MVQNISTNNSLSNNDSETKCIALPAPTSSTTNGYGNEINEMMNQSYAYGGNQSFVHSTNDVMQGTVQSDYSSNWSDSDNVVAGSSNTTGPVPGVVGLANIGNTCFMNSGLQCLINTPAISEYFLKHTFKTSSNLNNLALLVQFQNIVKQAWCSARSKLVLHDFKNCLALIHSQFKDSRQHDCQEFLALLLDSLHEQLKKWDEIHSKQLQNGRGDWGDSSSNDAEEAGNNNNNSSNIVCRRNSNIITSNEELSDCDPKLIEENNEDPELVNSTHVVAKSSETNSSVRVPLKHSSLKNYCVKENLSNFEAKSKSRILNKTVKGAEMSLFKLPNFTPTSSTCHAGTRNNNHNDNNLISSTQPKSSTNKSEKSWMTLKQQDRYDTGKSQFPRNRKKKFEDLDSPGSSKKKKFNPTFDDQQPQESKAKRSHHNNINDDNDEGILLDENEIDLKGTIEMLPDLPDSTNGIGGSGSSNNFSTACNGDIKDETMEINDDKVDLKISSAPKSDRKKLPPKRPTEDEEAARANEFWRKHIQANDTVIAKTFQGLLKSTVICSTCSYVSVTYEPFMYLTLPFPRILERKLAIWFINVNSRSPPQKVEITVGIMDSTLQLKQKFAKNILQDGREETNNLILAEVFNYRIGRLIDESVSMRKLNDNRNLYMYLLNENFDDKYGPLCTPTLDTNNYLSISNNNNNSYGPSTVYGPLTCSEMASADSSTTKDDNHMAFTKCEDTIANYDVSWDSPAPKPVELSSVSPKSSIKESAGKSSAEEPTVSSSIKDDQDIGGMLDVKIGQDQSMNCVTGIDDDQTMNCIICLEDCSISEMRQHVGCTCTICVHCLECSIKHHPCAPDETATNQKLKCATCMKTVDGKDFVQFRPNGENGSSKLTMEVVPLLFRHDPNPDANNNSSPVPRVFGYPHLIKIPSLLPAQEFYDFISSINPFPEAVSKILSVNEDGKSCGQCSRGISCRGCEFPRTGTIFIRPKSSIAISFIDLSEEVLLTIQPSDMTIEESSFTSWHRYNEPNYDIHDCLRAFSEIENLDEQNPWFCPHCEKNQCATKEISVCHFPDYLIVYLKRFVFMDHSSNKLNNKLKFPVNDLDLKEYIAPEFVGKDFNGLKDWCYDLYGCICHFGSISSGHYTAYGKNPVSKEWHYFNDENVTPQCPQDVEPSAYVLFYSRKGVQYDIPYQEKNRPLPELNTLNRIARPLQSVQPTNTIDTEEEDWDAEVSSSSSQIAKCSNYSGFSGGTIAELSLSVGVGSSDSSAVVVGNGSNWVSGNENDPVSTMSESGNCHSASSQCQEASNTEGDENEIPASSGYSGDSID